MTLRLDQWHQRFTQQAEWTRPLRDYCLALPGVKDAAAILEVGCGTGVITNAIQTATSAQVFGIDIRPERVTFACSWDPGTCYLAADANRLPFSDGCFSIVACHYFLLWCRDPVGVLREMRRVTQPGGRCWVLAEPDYAQRKDEPISLVPLGIAQTKALSLQGANPTIGSQLPDLLTQAGWLVEEFGKLESAKHASPTLPDNWDIDWLVMRDDLQGIMPAEQITAYQELDRNAWLTGIRRLHIPTFFALARRL